MVLSPAEPRSSAFPVGLSGELTIGNVLVISAFAHGEARQPLAGAPRHLSATVALARAVERVRGQASRSPRPSRNRNGCRDAHAVLPTFN